MTYQHDNLNEYEKNILGYVYAFSALGYLPTQINLNSANVVMATKNDDDSDVMYKFNDMNLDDYDYAKYKEQIIFEANKFYLKLVDSNLSEKDLSYFKSILSDLENAQDIWSMGNILIQYMNENAPYFLKDRFYKHKEKVSQSLNMLLKNISLTRNKTKDEEELDGLVRNMNQIYDEEKMNIVENEIKTKRALPKYQFRSDLVLRNVMRTLRISANILGM